MAVLACAAAWLSIGQGTDLGRTSSATAPPLVTRGSANRSSLPLQAQSAISSRIGASDAQFAPRRSGDGFGFDGGGVTAALDGGGIRLRGDGAHLQLGLEAIGRAGHLRAVAGVAPRVRSHRVVYAHGGGVLEWYAAGPLGIEQGFTLARRPSSGSGALVMSFALSGVRARVRGADVELLARGERVALRYGGLVARDARGRRLPAWLSVRGSRLIMHVADRRARYPLLIDPFIQQGTKLTPSDASGQPGFGDSVAVSADGNTVLVGGSNDNNDQGAAWVFTRSQGAWSQQGPKLTASGESGPGTFGSSVALSADGNTALIGGTADGGATGDDGSGAAWVFTRTGSTWSQQGAKLTGASQSGFGTSVALSADGSTALIGAPNDNNSAGTASVFARSGSQWTQQGSALTGAGESGEGNFGGDVALSGDGNTALVGGSADNNFTGAAWAFARSGSTWTQQGSKLTVADQSGVGEFGAGVALSGDGRTALIGAPSDGASGSAWVFKGGLSWTQFGPKLTATDATSQANFGTSVALSNDGQTALIGGEGDGNNGAAWMFAVSTLTQLGPKLTPADASGSTANFGGAVALSANASTALIGGLGDNRGTGAAWAFVAKSQTLYWDNPQAGTIGVDTGPPSQIDQGFIAGLQPQRRLGLATDGEHLYWTAGGFIARSNLDGSAVNQHFIAANANSVAVDGQHVYWTAGPSIGRANLDGTGIQAQFITVPAGLLTGLAVDSGHIYFKDQLHGSIGQANLDGTGINDAFIAGAGGSGGAVAVNAQNVYWTNQTGTQAPFAGTIGRANIDGTGATLNFITGVDHPSGVTVDDSFVYWASGFSCNNQTDPPSNCGGGTIGRANLDGSGVNQSFVTANQLAGPGCGTSPETRCGPTSVAVSTLPDGTAALYWDNPQVGAIGRETISGDPGNVNQSLVSGITQLHQVGVAVDRQHLYWSDGGSIGRSNLDGTDANQQFIQLHQVAANYVAVDDQHVYWSTISGIGRANLDGSGVNPDFISLPNSVGGIAVDSFHIYWTNRAQGTIGRANLDGTGVNSSFVTGATAPTDVAVDSQHIYWSQVIVGGNPPGGSIGRANLDGSDANPSFITGVTQPMGIAVDYANVYWTNYYSCNNHTQPPSGCGGGTIGRANLDGTGVNAAYVTAETNTGRGCNTTPQTRCGPTTVAVAAPTQPICMRTPLSPAPAPPPGGAVFARPLDASSADANVVVLPAGTKWTGDASCLGVTQGTAQVMTDPTSITVSPDAALLLHDQPAGLLSAWGAQDAAPAATLFPGRPDWQTTEVDLVAPQDLLATYGGCPQCILPNNLTINPVPSNPNIAYQTNLSGATANGATLAGNFDGWNFLGADLPDATLNRTQVSGANFTGADLRGAQLTSLGFTTPPDFQNVLIGTQSPNSQCTTFTDTNLVAAHLSQVTADVAGCETIPLLPGSSVPLGLIEELTVKDDANVDYSGATFIATAADRSVLAGADLHGINLGGANGLNGAKFLGFPPDLENTKFNGASLTTTNFDFADLANANFDDASADGATFSGANLNGATFAQATESLPPTTLENALFIGADVSNAVFQSADISNADFSDALAVGTTFDSVMATNTRFRDAHIYGDRAGFEQARDLTGADFTGALLGGSADGTGGFDFSGATLTGAKFDSAQCIACNFTTATLTSVNFSGAYLPGAQLASAANLQHADFEGAWLYCGDSTNSSCPTDGPDTWDWPLRVGSQETYGPVPFSNTTLTESQFANVTACPDTSSPGTNGAGDCEGHLVPLGKLVIPLPCSAAALDACVTRTSTLLNAGKLGSPLAVVPATPPTWASTVSTPGDYVGLSDGTVRLITGGRPPAVVIAGSHNAHCPQPTQSCGDGGSATKALLGTPSALAVGLDGSLYIADPTLRRVRRIDPSGIITTVAGTGASCSDATATCGDGGPATAATLSGPTGVWADPAGDLYIADGERGIREVLPDGTIRTVGPSPGTYDFVSVTGDATGHLYAATRNPDYLVQIDPTGSEPAKVVVGTGTSGFNGNRTSSGLLPGSQVQINQPGGLSAALNGDIIFADTGNHLIRAYVPTPGTVIELGGMITNGQPVGGFNKDGRYANQTEFQDPVAVSATKGALILVADTGSLQQRVREIGPNPPPRRPVGTGGPPPGVGAPAPVGTPGLVGTGGPAPVTGAPSGSPASTHGSGHRHRQPSNRFKVSHLATHRNGTITLAVKVPGRGRIDLLATAWNNNLAHVTRLLAPAPHRFVFGRSHRSVRRATTVRLTVRPSARGRRLLHHHTYRVTLRLWVSFTPTGGRPRNTGFHGLRLPR